MLSYQSRCACVCFTISQFFFFCLAHWCTGSCLLLQTLGHAICCRFTLFSCCLKIHHSLLPLLESILSLFDSLLTFARLLSIILLFVNLQRTNELVPNICLVCMCSSFSQFFCGCVIFLQPIFRKRVGSSINSPLVSLFLVHFHFFFTYSSCLEREKRKTIMS